MRRRAFAVAIASLALTACSKSYRVGDRVLVEWEHADYPASIQGVEGPKYKVHYEGYESIWDESVPVSRIKRKIPESEIVVKPPPPPKVRARMSASSKAQLSTFKIGDRVKVDWKGTYYPATILVVLGGEQYRVHYEGYDSNWDENVDITKIQRKLRLCWGRGGQSPTATTLDYSPSMRRIVLAVPLALALVAHAPQAFADPAPTHAAPEVRKLGEAFGAVAEKLGPSVVQIDVTTRDEQAALVASARGLDPSVAVQRGMGSGVVLSADGAILTNNHVIEHALAIDVRLPDGRLLAAKLVGRDPATDLAVLRVGAKDLVPARFGDSDAAKVGEWVVAIGSPFGLGYTVTTGVVSAKGRGSLGVSAVEDYLQTDAGINPGNSGGPLSNLDGEVLGINTMIVGRGTGLGFAVPSSLARRVAAQLLAKGKVERPFVGMGVQDVTPALAEELKSPAGVGALVREIVAGGPAAKANLKAGDVVASVGGKPLRGAQDFLREVLSRDVGAVVPLEVMRGGQKYGTSVTLSARNESAPPAIPAQQVAPSAGLGITVRDLPTEGGATACQITAVTVGSPGDRAGLKAGDLLVEVDGVASPKVTDVQRAAKNGHGLFRVLRQTSLFYAALRPLAQTRVCP